MLISCKLASVILGMLNLKSIILSQHISELMNNSRINVFCSNRMAYKLIQTGKKVYTTRLSVYCVSE